MTNAGAYNCLFVYFYTIGRCCFIVYNFDILLNIILFYYLLLVNDSFTHIRSSSRYCHNVLTATHSLTYSITTSIGDRGNHVPGLTTIQVEDLSNVLDLLAISDKNRFSRTTNMNEHSSRSHMMLSVNVTSENLITGHTTRGKLNLVDLAGSERINKSGKWKRGANIACGSVCPKE